MAALILAAAPGSASAAGGDADTSFSGDGRLAIDVANNFVARAMAVQPDGRIVIGGYSCVPGSSRDGTCTSDGSSSFRLIRLTADGGLDPEFGGDGIVTTAIGSGRSQAFDVVLMPDGDIVAGGGARSNNRDVLGLVRYDANGDLDRTFSGDGIVVQAVGSGFAAVADVMAGPNGTIYAAGQATDSGGARRAMVARVRPDGSLDPAFGQNGVFIGGPPFGFVLGLAPAADGGLLAAGVAGESSDPSQISMGLLRLEPAGTPLTSFSGDGSAQESAGGRSSFANAAAPLPGDAWFIAGAALEPGGNQAMALLKERADGTPDPGWGTNGSTLLRLGDGSVANDAVTLPDGRAIAVGQAASGSRYSFAHARVTAGGALDQTFGQGGWAVTSWDSHPVARATAGALDGNGRLLAAGIGCAGGSGPRCDGGRSVLLLARYLADPPAPPPPPAPAQPAADRKAPAARLRKVPKRMRRSSLVKYGLPFVVEVDEDVSVDVKLRVERKRSKRTAILEHRTVPVGAGPFEFRLRPGPRVRQKQFRKTVRIVVVLRDRAGNRTVLRASVRLR